MNAINSVGIDVSKGKSMVAILRPMGEVVMLPREYPHIEEGLCQLSADIRSLGENTRVIMEATGGYHDSVAVALHNDGIFVSVLTTGWICGTILLWKK